ncbi:hypothetical protein T06_12144 [Trichinella sp. T6]|nr:hypothetical protein T06_12144 [Trichinella sp. T6]
MPHFLEPHRQSVALLRIRVVERLVNQQLLLDHGKQKRPVPERTQAQQLHLFDAQRQTLPDHRGDRIVSASFSGGSFAAASAFVFAVFVVFVGVCVGVVVVAVAVVAEHLEAKAEMLDHEHGNQIRHRIDFQVTVVFGQHQPIGMPTVGSAPSSRLGRLLGSDPLPIQEQVVFVDGRGHLQFRLQIQLRRRRHDAVDHNEQATCVFVQAKRHRRDGAVEPLFGHRQSVFAAVRDQTEQQHVAVTDDQSHVRVDHARLVDFFENTQIYTLDLLASMEQDQISLRHLHHVGAVHHITAGDCFETDLESGVENFRNSPAQSENHRPLFGGQQHVLGSGRRRSVDRPDQLGAHGPSVQHVLDSGLGQQPRSNAALHNCERAVGTRSAGHQPVAHIVLIKVVDHRHRRLADRDRPARSQAGQLVEATKAEFGLNQRFGGARANHFAVQMHVVEQIQTGVTCRQRHRLGWNRIEEEEDEEDEEEEEGEEEEEDDDDDDDEDEQTEDEEGEKECDDELDREEESEEELEEEVVEAGASPRTTTSTCSTASYAYNAELPIAEPTNKQLLDTQALTVDGAAPRTELAVSTISLTMFKRSKRRETTNTSPLRSTRAALAESISAAWEPSKVTISSDLSLSG